MPPAWTGWVPWRSDDTSGQESWWDTHAGDYLRDSVGLFVDALADPARGDVVHHLAHHPLAANQRHTVLEGRVRLATAPSSTCRG